MRQQRCLVGSSEWDLSFFPRSTGRLLQAIQVHLAPARTTSGPEVPDLKLRSLHQIHFGGRVLSIPEFCFANAGVRSRRATLAGVLHTIFYFRPRVAAAFTRHAERFDRRREHAAATIVECRLCIRQSFRLGDRPIASKLVSAFEAGMCVSPSYSSMAFVIGFSIVECRLCIRLCLRLCDRLGVSRLVRAFAASMCLWPSYSSMAFVNNWPAVFAELSITGLVGVARGDRTEKIGLSSSSLLPVLGFAAQDFSACAALVVRSAVCVSASWQAVRQCPR